MKRWHVYIAALIAALIITIGVRHVLGEQARQKRELRYQNALRSYSEALKTGINRKQVEGYFSAKHVSFSQTCCVSVKEFTRGVYDNAYDDLVKVGQEDAPWFCSENNVYVAFQFLGSDKDSFPKAEATDRLKDVTLYRKLDGCL